ncbi:c-type cytochrome [Pontibacter harenae]|uniref:c-type cytochrome n=1 Tax=Pontibacter harenae TaxID=2894083 RepID=UPI001E64DBE0|nr:c-type cytochrome [Pontibacter harenae]MCC9165515.1 c-type cytochrome [Pontibacter harenae]
MKKIFLAAACVAFMAACGGNSNSSEYEDVYEGGGATETTATAPEQQQPEPVVDAEQNPYEKGEKLIANSDCLSCHKAEGRLVGPGYNEVAEKYELNDQNVDYLAQKIIKGGSGVWGEIPMSPHPDLSKEDANEMAKYILSLNQ